MACSSQLKDRPPRQACFRIDSGVGRWFLHFRRKGVEGRATEGVPSVSVKRAAM